MVITLSPNLVLSTSPVLHYALEDEGNGVGQVKVYEFDEDEEDE